MKFKVRWLEEKTALIEAPDTKAAEKEALRVATAGLIRAPAAAIKLLSVVRADLVPVTTPPKAVA